MRYVETIENRLLVGDQQLDFPSKFAPWTFERGLKQLKEKNIYIYKKKEKGKKRRNHQSCFLAERIGLRVSQILGRTWFDRAFETFQCYIGFVGDIRAYTNSANTPTYRGEQPATLAMLVEVKYLSTCRNVRGSTSYVGGENVWSLPGMERSKQLRSWTCTASKRKKKKILLMDAS